MSVWWPEDNWEPIERPVVVFLDGPERIYDDEAKPSATRRVGFGIEPEPVEPLLWDGDNT